MQNNIVYHYSKVKFDKFKVNFNSDRLEWHSNSISFFLKDVLRHVQPMYDAGFPAWDLGDMYYQYSLDLRDVKDSIDHINIASSSIELDLIDKYWGKMTREEYDVLNHGQQYDD